MNKHQTCAACNMEKNGVKSRIAFTHTCGMYKVHNDIAPKKLAYIVGKVTGEPAHLCSVKFGSRERSLREKGYNVINPLALVATVCGDDDQWLKTDWQSAMRICIAAMMAADEVHILSDWQQSKGAMLERDIAVRMGIKVVYH